MLPLTDYSQQTEAVNDIDGETITEIMRTVCYDQFIYNDSHLERDEWLGLTLAVDRSSVFTIVVRGLNQAAIVIHDDEGNRIKWYPIRQWFKYLSFQWLWLVWRR